MEKVILSNLIANEAYTRKVITFLKPDYFSDRTDHTLFSLISTFFNKYNSLPSKEALSIDLANLGNMSEDQFKETASALNGLTADKDTELEWLIDNTEVFCQDKAIYNAIRESIKVLDGGTDVTKNAIPKMLQDALQVSFDTRIGHDYYEDANERYESYHRTQKLIPFDLEYMNKITGGGFPPGSLNVFLAGTGVGKSLTMCHMASYNLLCNKNVLYITLEMSEVGKPSISQRIDTNLLNINVHDLMDLTKDTHSKKVARLKADHPGKLIIKQYPTAAAGVGHFRHLINELRVKKSFVPDIIYVDYLNICTSSRLKFSANVNSYTYVKAIAEELRGLAVELDLPIVTATQTNRGALTSSDVGLENTSDSMGLPMTADFMVALMSPPELRELNQILVKQLKNRYGDLTNPTFFVIGVDYAKMRLYDVDPSAQEDLLGGPKEEDKPVMDTTPFGEREEEIVKFDKRKFEGFK